MMKVRPRSGMICVSVHMPRHIKDDLSKVAEEEARTLSRQLRKLAEDFLAERSADAA
jgi:hypothetical protein